MSISKPMLPRQVHLRQAFALTRAGLKARYRKTVAGFIWVVLNPLLMFGVQSLVFSRFLKLEVPNFELFLLTGLIPWIFIVQSLEMCTPIFVNSGRALKAFQIHPLVYLLAQLADNAINFLGAFLLVLIPALAARGEIGSLIYLPLPLLSLFLGVFSLSWLLASLQVFFRDTRFLVPFATSLGFFLTPVFYPKQFVPAEWRFLIELNPFHRWIDPFRLALYSPGLPHSDAATAFTQSLLLSTLVSLIFLAAAAGFWSTRRNSVYLNV